MNLLHLRSVGMITIFAVLNFALVHSAVGSQSNAATVYYVLPSSATQDQCPTTDSDSCLLNISSLAGSTGSRLGANTTLVFLAGSHTLDKRLILSGINTDLCIKVHWV